MTKIRAGTAYGCQFAQSGCNGPKEGQCMNLCLHRLPIDFAHSDEEEADISAGYESAMKAPIKRLFAEQIAAEEVDESDDFSSSRGLAVALLLTFFSIVIGSFLVVVMS